MLTIKEKIDLLDMLKAGRSNVDVGRHYGINESTVRYIRKDEKKIRQTSQIMFNKAAKRMVTPRNKRLMKMEAALSVWVQDCRKKSIALDTNTIRTKAQQLYNRLADTEGGDADEAMQMRETQMKVLVTLKTPSHQHLLLLQPQPHSEQAKGGLRNFNGAMA
ncbi:tigger transposable element-derived protein 1-like [Erythrolamprus reginae]|uniref:tigger transposable element-derived protein 1-like n=1 Tax=Erythrolamprus reginae TaxID=121349 RepID=UPI00396C7006